MTITNAMTITNTMTITNIIPKLNIITFSFFPYGIKMDFDNEYDNEEYSYEDYSNVKYKVSISADDETYVEEPEPEVKKGRGCGKRRTGVSASSYRKTPSKDYNGATKIGDIIYIFGEKLISARPRLSKMANDLFSEAYGLLQKMSIRTRRGKKANLAAFFTLYLASKKLKLGVDPVLMAMDFGLTSKDTVLAIEEFIPDLNTTNPLEMEILELIYKVEMSDIMEEYFERMWSMIHDQRKDLADAPLWKRICDSVRKISYEDWCSKNRDNIPSLMEKNIHVISPQKFYVLLMYNTIRQILSEDEESITGMDKHMQKIFSSLWGQIANNMEKTRKKTVGCV